MALSLENSLSINAARSQGGAASAAAPFSSPSVSKVSTQVNANSGEQFDPVVVSSEDTVDISQALSKKEDSSLEEKNNELVTNESLNTRPLEANDQQQEEERIKEAAEEISEKLNESLSVRFRTDEETGESVYQFVEKETGDVVRQIPPKDLVEFNKRFDEAVSGLLLSEQA